MCQGSRLLAHLDTATVPRDLSPRIEERGVAVWKPRPPEGREGIVNSLSSTKWRRRLGRGGRAQLFETGRNESMVFYFAIYFHRSCPAVQGVPDRKQYSVRIPVPLMIPKTAFFDPPAAQKPLPLLITADFPRRSVPKTIQLHRQSRRRTIEIENVFAHRMLGDEI
jgi:hypothetical protein